MNSHHIEVSFYFETLKQANYFKQNIPVGMFKSTNISITGRVEYHEISIRFEYDYNLLYEALEYIHSDLKEIYNTFNKVSNDIVKYKQMKEILEDNN